MFHHENNCSHLPAYYILANNCESFQQMDPWRHSHQLKTRPILGCLLCPWPPAVAPLQSFVS